MRNLRTLLLAFALALPLGTTAQPPATPPQNVDSAAMVVDTYLRLLNSGAVPHDSCLYLRTVITTTTDTATIIMQRWFARDGMARIEVRFGDSLMTGLCTNGNNRYRRYLPVTQWWEDTDTAQFLTRMEGYDYRCPLQDWRGKQCRLQWIGTSTIEGHPLLAVLVQREEWHDRVYFFDPDNRLLTFVQERDEVDGKLLPKQRGGDNHIEWKAFHEYQPIGKMLQPSLESFKRGSVVTVMQTEVHLIALDPFLFNHD